MSLEDPQHLPLPPRDDVNMFMAGSSFSLQQPEQLGAIVKQPQARLGVQREDSHLAISYREVLALGAGGGGGAGEGGSMQGLPILGRVYDNELPEILKIIKMYHLCLGSSKFLREPIYINVYSENVCSVPYNFTHSTCQEPLLKATVFLWRHIIFSIIDVAIGVQDCRQRSHINVAFILVNTW